MRECWQNGSNSATSFGDGNSRSMDMSAFPPFEAYNAADRCVCAHVNYLVCTYESGCVDVLPVACIVAPIV